MAEDPVAAFEAALLAGDHEAAKTLVRQQADPSAAFLRVWNMAAYGEDSTEQFSIARDQQFSRRAAQRIAEAVITEHGGRRSCDTLRPYMLDPKVGRASFHERDLPWLAYQVVSHLAMTDQAAAAVVARAWTSAEYPEVSIGADAWRMLFALVGRTVTDAEDGTWDAPQEPVRLWRGAIPSRALGMAWTGDRERAGWFADRWNGHLDGVAVIWTALVEPRRILGRFTGRGEDEYVLDTTGLDVDEEAAQ